MDEWGKNQSSRKNYPKNVKLVVHTFEIFFPSLFKRRILWAPLRLQINVKKIPSWVTRWRDCKVCWICMPLCMSYFAQSETAQPTNQEVL